MIGTNLLKQILYFKYAKYWQNIGNALVIQYNAMHW